MLRKEKGFTLIELLIVVAIIGIIAAIAVPNLLTAIQRSKRSRTAADLRAIGTALGSYNVDNNQFPTSANAAALFTLLREQKHYQGSTADGWNNPYIYSGDANGYTLRSYGKDGAAGPAVVGDGLGNNDNFNYDVIYINGGFVAPPYIAQQ
ncbi:general secretion pathway protein G [Candidatus Vecturithrix granuli]|uniref:General secretion pathway protein G n=1 Tax=Vecturithrix granuli TaxID=1499967 RepID=A0A081BYX6_VECG1|nr:general secretion pathway protein G [Candidatus Vecturithrix granuli]